MKRSQTTSPGLKKVEVAGVSDRFELAGSSLALFADKAWI